MRLWFLGTSRYFLFRTTGWGGHSVQLIHTVSGSGRLLVSKKRRNKNKDVKKPHSSLDSIFFLCLIPVLLSAGVNVNKL